MIPFILPFTLYLVFSQFLSHFPDQYPVLYGITIILVGLSAIILLRGKKIIKMHSQIAPGILFGIIGIIAWILICRLQLEQSITQFLPEWLRPEARASYNPFQSIDNTTGQIAFIMVRLLGLAILVPVIEEVFWRGFLLRWIISPDWQQEKIGVFTIKSFIWINFLFALAHPEWFAAFVYSALITILLYWKRDLWNCIVAHATSNLLLGGYVLYTGNWGLW